MIYKTFRRDKKISFAFYVYGFNNFRIGLSVDKFKLLGSILVCVDILWIGFEMTISIKE